MPLHSSTTTPYNPDELLLGYQRAWVQDDSKLKICAKSRRTGITWAEASDATLCGASSKQAGGTHHFYVGSTKEMAREFIDAVADWAQLYNRACSEVKEEYIADENKDILTYVVYFKSGFKVQALSSNPKNLRGMQGNVTIDEAAFHDKLEEVLKAALALTMWGGKVRLISTHNGDENLFNELVKDSIAGKKDYSVHQVTLDDALADGLYKRICEIKGERWSKTSEQAWVEELMRNTKTREDALEEYYCVPKQGGSSYLSRALIESRAVKHPVFRFEGGEEFNRLPEYQREMLMKDWLNENILPELAKLNQNSRHVFGEDFGRSGDLTVIWPASISQDLTMETPFIVELRNVPYHQQRQVLFFVCDRLPKLSGGALDARGNGEYLAEQAQERYGSQVVETVKITNAWYLSVMPKLKARFEDGSLTIPRDENVVSDLRALQVIKGIPKVPDGKTGESKNRHGDSAVALAMAVHMSQNDPVLIEFTPIDKTDVWGAPSKQGAMRDLNTNKRGAW